MTQTAAPVTVVATVELRSATVGMILTDAQGMTLYAFDHDQPGATVSACTGACATRWPALTATGTPTAGAAVPGSLTTVQGAQVAWNGKLLYRFSGDRAPGDMNGEGVGGVWHAVQPGVGATPATTAAPGLVGGY